MKKISYKIISVILAVLMVTSCMPITTFAETYAFRNINISESGENEVCTWNYYSTTKTLYIDGKDITPIHGNYLPTYDASQNPITYCYKNFKHIVFGKNVETVTKVLLWTDNYPSLETIEFEEGSKLRLIGDGVFACTNIYSISLPDSLEEIEIEAFASSKLESITIPASVKTIGPGVFGACENLTSITFETRDDEPTIHEAAFSGTAITTFDFNDFNYSGTSIPEDFFVDCKCLTSVTLTDNMNEIGMGAFSGCSSLTQFDFTPFVKIGNCAFEETSLKNVKADNVTALGSDVFSGCKRLETADFPNATTLGQYAFYNCSALKNVNIPNVSKINKYTFFGCSALTDFDLSNVTMVYDYAFRRSGITSANMPKTTKINQCAFEDCKNLTSVTLGLYLTSIGSNAFRNCSNLDLDDLPSSVTSVGANAFENTGITEVTLHSNITYSGSVYSYCYKLKKVTIDNNVTVIPSNMFSVCPALTDVKLGARLRTIRDYAFRNCSSLKNIDFPNSVEVIDMYAFGDCTSLESITLPNSLTTIGGYVFYGCENLKNVVLPESLTTIEKYAFSGCSSLTDLVFYPNLATVEYDAFKECTSLEKVVITNFYIKLGADVFDGANPVIYGAKNSYAEKYATSNELTFKAKGSGDLSAEIEDLIEEKDPVKDNLSGTWQYGTWRLNETNTVLYIDGEYSENGKVGSSGYIYTGNGTQYGSFKDLCYKKGISHIDVVFGEGITSIQGKILSGSSSNEVVFDYVSLPDSLEEIGKSTFSGVKINKLFVGSKLKTIGDDAFYNSGILEIVFSNNNVLESVGYSAFYGNKLTKFNFPKSVKVFDDRSFYGNKFEKIDLSNYSSDTQYGTYMFATAPVSEVNLGKIKEIPDYMFYQCGKLKEITIPSTVTSIGIDAFCSCVNLEKVTLPSNITTLPDYCFASTAITNINIDNVTSIGAGCFSNSKLTTIEIPKVTSVSTKAFYSCQNLTNVVLPSATAIQDSAFYNCTALTRVTAPNVTYVGNSTFYNCKKLSLVSLSDDLTSIGNSAFYGTAIESVNLQANVSYGSGCFAYCYSLNRVTIRSDVTSIPASIFKECASLSKLYFENDSKLETIGAYAFEYCDSLTKIVLPASVKTIGSYAFAYCNNLEYMVLGNKVEAISNHAFYSTNLKYLVVPKFIVTIDSNAISKCENLICAINSCAAEKYVNVGAVNVVSSAGSDYIADYSELSFIASYNTKHDYDIEVRKNSVYGAWENGSWGYSADQTQLYIYGTGTLTNTFENANGSEISLTDILKQKNGTLTVYIGGGINKIGDDFAKGEKGEITNLVLQDSVVNIGNSAFTGVNISKVTLNDYVSLIGAHAFENCKLSTVSCTSPMSLENIGDYAFCNNELTSVFNLGALCYIGAHAFENNAITSFDGTGKTLVLGNYVFNNNKLSSVTLTTANILGEYVFANSIAATMTVTLPNEMTEIPDGLFANCTGIKKLTLPESLTTIGYESFKGISVEGLTFENKVATISSKAFYNCEKLKTVVIGENVKHIGSAAFGYCPLLTSFNVISDDVFIYTDTVDKSKSAVGFTDNGNLVSSLIIQGSAASTAYDYAYKMGLPFLTTGSECENCGYISKSATNYNGVLSSRWEYYDSADILYISGSGIVAGNWYDNNGNPVDVPKASKIIIISGIGGLETSFAPVGAKEITIPRTVTDIYDCFQNCVDLEYVSIPDSVVTMNNETFKGCKNLKSLSLGTGLKTIPYKCAAGCTNLKYLFLYGSQTIGEYAFRDCSSLQTITIPESVEVIKQNAFENCHSVFNITLGKSVKSIGSRAFANMPLLDTITYLGSINYIDNNVFDGCSTSTSGVDVVLGDDVVTASVDGVKNINVNSISVGKKFKEFTNTPNIPALKKYVVSSNNDNGYAVYKDCLYKNDTLVLAPQGLDNIEIKQGTTAINDYAFSYSNINTIRIPDGVKQIGDYAFYKAKNLKAVRFPSTVEIIGNSAFEECTKLKTMSIPYPCKTIGDKAFKNCKILASVLLPEGLLTIGDDCFNGCVAIESMVFPQSLVSIGGGALAFNPNLKSIFVWNATLGYNIFYNSSIPIIYTTAGSNAHGTARTKKYPFLAYTDEEIFAEICFEAIDELSGYLGYCTDGHGDIEWLEVYEGDCENDGYAIGVCEYCSEILDEKHTYATGHQYSQIAYMKETATDYGIRVLRCDVCAERYTTYYKPLGEYTPSIGVYNVSGKVYADTGKAINNENTAVENAEIVINGDVVARTDENGNFRFKMKSGLYVMEVRYIYGFSRYLVLSVTDHDIKLSDYEPITIVACDFNKDGVIDAADQSLFMLVIASKEGDTSYLKFIDLNNDGYINAKDYIIIGRFYGETVLTYQYPARNIS